GKILWVNAAYTRMSGYNREESLGKTPRILKSEFTHPEVYASLWDTISQGKVWRGELHNKHKDGYIYATELTITPLLSDEGHITHYIAILQDITERKEQERSQKAQLQIAQALEDAENEEEIIKRVVHLGCEIFSAQACAFSKEEDNREYIVTAEGAWDSLQGCDLPSEWPRPQKGAFTLLDSVPQEAGGLPFLGVLRLQTGSEPLGYLWIGSHTPLLPTTQQLLQDIHPTIAHALQRVRLLQNTRKQLQRINALHTIDMAIASSVDINITLNILLEQLTNSLPVEAVIVSMYSPRDNTLKPVQHRNLPKGTRLSMTRRLTTHYIATVMRTRKPLIIPDLRKATQPLDELGRLLSQVYSGYACLPLLAKGKINGVLEIYSREVFHPNAEWMEFLNILSGQAAIAIENATLFTNLQRSKDELTVSYESALLGWSRSLAIRHREPPEHAERVAQLAFDLAHLMGIRDEAVLRSLRYGAWLHDVGKLGIPEEILHKSEHLNEEECAIFRRTPEFARRFLQDIPLLEEASVIPVYRYECWDGSGYPEGLSGELIPLPARIFAVVHTWDARREERHYAPALSREERIAYLQEQAGKQFDPHIVQVFLESGLE
ncbi:MAG: PAS domain S-box protein, partial [Anaerolineae bacterium]